MALDDDIAFLGQIATFRVLGREALRILAISAEPLELEGGEQLFNEGDAADGGYVVVDGAIELTSAGDRGGESSIARSGTLIGETAMIIDTIRPAAAMALEPTSLLRVPRIVFLRLLEGEPGAAIALRKMMGARLRSTLQDLDLVAPLFVKAPEEEKPAQES